MPRSILFVSLVVLAKLHLGESPAPYGVERYGSPSFRRFGPRPSTPPPPATPPPPPARPLTPMRSDRFDRTTSLPSAPQLPATHPFLRSRLAAKTAAPSSSPLRGRPITAKPAQKPLPPAPTEDKVIEERGWGDDDDDHFGHFSPFTQIIPSSGDYYPQSGGFTPSGGHGQSGGHPNASPRMQVMIDSSGKRFEVPEGLIQDGEMISDEEIQRRLKKYHEENDPDNHKINTTGEVIEKQVSRGSQIVIKISGSNITERQMKILRKMMTDSVDLVFEHTEFKTSLLSRYI